jgi:hypothetical protein
MISNDEVGANNFAKSAPVDEEMKYTEASQLPPIQVHLHRFDNLKSLVDSLTYGDTFARTVR